MSRHRGRSTQTRRTASCLKPIQQVGSPTHARSTDRQKCAKSCMIAARPPPSQQNYATGHNEQDGRAANNNKPVLLLVRELARAVGDWADVHHDAIEALSAFGAFIFTIVLAISTTLLWSATKNLWTEARVQRAENKIAFDQQLV